MIEENYSQKKTKELESKIGNPEVLLSRLASMDSSITQQVQFELDHYKWRDINSIEDAVQWITRLEEVVTSDEFVFYDQMLMIFRRAFMSVQKLSVLDPHIESTVVDSYVAKLGELFDKMNEKNSIQSMRED